MSFRYRERTVVDGEAIDPHDWYENTNALGGELNGQLDRDNLPERAIITTMVADNTFNKFYQSIQTSTRNWLSSRNFVVAEQTFEIDEDGVLIVHFGATWQWPGIVNNPTFATGNVVYFNLKLSVNGTVIANGLNFTLNQGAYSTYLVGTFPVVGGSVTVKCDAIAGGVLPLQINVDFEDTVVTSLYKRR